MESYGAESDIPTAPIEEPLDWRRFALDVVETVLLSVVLYLGINALTARVRVDGYSMLPTLNDGEYVLVSKLAYRKELPRRGDIIVFRFPVNPRQDFIKRVIGLPGEEVRIDNGTVYINGVALDEEYIAAPPRYSGKWTVPPGYLFVLGDNRNDSSDSHTWGLVPMQNVIGKAVLVYWPPLSLALIDHAQVAVAAP